MLMQSPSLNSPLPSAPRKRHKRNGATVAVLVAILALGYVISLVPGRGVDVRHTKPGVAPDLALESRSPAAGFDTLQPAPHGRSTRPETEPEPVLSVPTADPQKNPQAYARQVRDIQAKNLLGPVAAEIAAGRHKEAIAMLNRIRPSVQDMPEAYLHMGKALRGSGDPRTAMDFFLAAIDRDPTYADAYFEFATTAEELGDLESALGGMRSFLHMAKDRNPYRLQIAQARSAIWEIESKLGRGEWGETRGIPPGFTAEELKRDGKGVGVKMPIPGTERADGTTDYEIRANEKREIFKK